MMLLFEVLRLGEDVTWLWGERVDDLRPLLASFSAGGSTFSGRNRAVVIRYTGDDFSDRLLVDRKYRKQVKPLHMDKKQLLQIG